jgi:hypothetical protein
MSYSKYRNTLSEEQSGFVRENFHRMTNPQMAKALGVKLWQVRYALYPLGIRRMELEYWTEEQVEFLRANYREIGDKELAEMFSERWHKKKGWSKKHIEKKRRYLKLKRTEAERGRILIRNRSQGRHNTVQRSWETRGYAQVGDTAEWPDQHGTVRRFVKTERGFVHMGPWLWRRHHGPIPRGHNVCFKDGDPLNCDIGNLELVSNAELARRNAEKASVGLSDNYVAGMLSYRNPGMRKELLKHPEIIEAHRLGLKINRLINQKTKN